MNTQEAYNREVEEKEIRNMYIGIISSIIQAYHKNMKENKNCQLINMFRFDQGEDLETSLIRTLFNGIYIKKRLIKSNPKFKLF